MINLFGPLRHKTPVFDTDGGGSGGGGGKEDKKEKKSKPKTSGQVTSTGQYAGDGFSWVDDPTKNYKTRTYTGVGKDNGLGQDVSIAGASNNKTKARIGAISLEEGSPYAGSKTSSTDGDLLNFFKTGSFGASDSYAAQMGNNNYTPTVNKNAGSFGDAFSAARKSGGPGKTFDYKGNSYTTDLAPAAPAAPATSLRPQLRPAAAPTMTGDPQANIFNPIDVGTRPVDYTPTLGGGDPFVDPYRVASVGGGRGNVVEALGDRSAVNYTPTSGGITQLDFDIGSRLAPGNIGLIDDYLGRPDPAYKIGDRIPSGNAQRVFDEFSQEYGEPAGSLSKFSGYGGNNSPSPLPDRGGQAVPAAFNMDAGALSDMIPQGSRRGSGGRPTVFDEAGASSYDSAGLGDTAFGNLLNNYVLGDNAQLETTSGGGVTSLPISPVGGGRGNVVEALGDRAAYTPPTRNAPEGVLSFMDPVGRVATQAEQDAGLDQTGGEGTGFGGLTKAGLMNAGELVVRGGEAGSNYFFPADQYKFGDASIGLPQLDSSLNVIPEIDMGFAKALGADPNRRGMVAGTENRVGTYLGGVADNIQENKEEVLENIKDTTFGQAKNRTIFGTGRYGPDPMALLSEIVYGLPTTAAIVGTSVANPAAGAALGAVMTTGELTSEVGKRMDARIANGEFGPISNDQAAQLKTDYVQQITPLAAGMGVVEGLTFGLGGRYLPGFKSKTAAAFGEGFLSEGLGEPTLAESVLAGDGQSMVLTPTFDEEGAIIGPILGGAGSVMSTAANAAKFGPRRDGSGIPIPENSNNPSPIVGTSVANNAAINGQILDPLISPTAGQLAKAPTVNTAYDGTAVDLNQFGGTGPIITPRADNNTQVADQTTLMEQELTQKAKDDGAALLSEMILNDASLEQSATTGNIAELASKLELPMNQAVEVAENVSERAAREKADMLGLIASDEVNTTGSINAETLAEINTMLSEEMAAAVIDQANANENLDGQSALDLFLEEDINTATAKRQAAERQARETENAELLSSMSGIELAPMAAERKGPDDGSRGSNVAEDIITGTEAPSVTTEVSDLQAQENYNAIQAQEAAYNQTLTETGDVMAAEAAADAAYNNALAPKLSTPEADGSVVVNNVVPISPSISEVADMQAPPPPPDTSGGIASSVDLPINSVVPSVLSVPPSIGVQPSITDVADQIAAEVEVPVEEQLALDLDTPKDDTFVEVDAPEVSEIQETPVYNETLSDSAKYLRGIVGDGKSQIDDGTVVDNDLQTKFVEVDVPETGTDVALSEAKADMLDASNQTGTEVIVENQLPTVIETPTDVSIPLEPIVIEETEPNTMKTVVENTPLLTNQEAPVAVEVPVEKKTNRPFVPFNTAYVPPSDGGDGDDDDPSTPTFTTTKDGVTVGLPSDGGDGFAPVLGTNEEGDPTMECPEGYELVDGPSGPTCVKIEESYQLRAGAGTAAYTGQTIRRGDTGPGQRRKVFDKRTYTAATPVV